MFRVCLCLTFSGFPLLFFVLLFHGVTLHPNRISISDYHSEPHSVPAVGAGNDSVSIVDFACPFFMKGRPTNCFLLFFEIVLLFTFLLLPFYFLPFPLHYFINPSPNRMPFGTTSVSVPADRAGRRYMVLPRQGFVQIQASISNLMYTNNSSL